MKKYGKLFTVFLLTLAAALCLFAGCGDGTTPGQNTGENPGGTGGNPTGGTSEPIVYSVSVVSPYGIAIDGVTVKWGNESAVTDQAGRAEKTLPEAEYTVTLENLPDVYTYDSVKTSASNANVTVRLKHKSEPQEGKLLYTVRVVLADGTPVQGVRVELCIDTDGEGGICVPFRNVTDARGETYAELDANQYKGKIISPKNTYSYESDEEDYYIGGIATAEAPYLLISVEKI